MLHNSERSATYSFWMLVGFLAVLWIAGGASRADVIGQPIVRAFAWIVPIFVIVASPRVGWRDTKVPTLILVMMALLITVQLAPLPPGIWTSLPGREIFIQNPAFTGLDQPWRPISISPDGTRNALSSLIVPTAILLLASNLRTRQHWQILQVLLLLILAGLALGIMQFSGAHFNNPLMNKASGIAVSGNFANRNHFALFLSMGALLLFAWSFQGKSQMRKMLILVGALPLLVLTILATGSRTGLLLCFVGCMFGALIVRRPILRELSKLPRKRSIIVAILAGILLFGAVLLSIFFGRAEALDRVLTVDDAANLRGQIWSAASEVTLRYFPIGSGFGTFDPAFRISEPDIMLNPKYINQAHNDWLQIILEGGIAGALLLTWALIWFVKRNLLVWRGDCDGSKERVTLARVGSILILLTMVASFLDYPARTPMIMAIIMLAAIWLSRACPSARRSTSPP